jgi:hypothetical protein
MIHVCLTKQDPMIQIFEQGYIPVLTNKTIFQLFEMIQIFEQGYIPVLTIKAIFNFLILFTSLFDIQDSIIEIV